MRSANIPLSRTTNPLSLRERAGVRVKTTTTNQPLLTPPTTPSPLTGEGWGEGEI